MNLSPFSTKVYNLVKQIPPGKVLSYQDVARLVGSPKAARAVGALMKYNPDIENIPCHRVIGSDGKWEVIEIEARLLDYLIYNPFQYFQGINLSHLRIPIPHIPLPRFASFNVQYPHGSFPSHTSAGFSG